MNRGMTVSCAAVDLIRQIRKSMYVSWVLNNRSDVLILVGLMHAGEER